MLLNSISELSAVLPITSTFEFGALEPYLRRAQRTYLAPVLGPDLLTLLSQPAASLTDLQQQAREYACEVVAHYAAHDYFPVGGLIISATGIQVSKGKDKQAAEQWRIETARAGLLESANNATEALLHLLEANRLAFPQWAGTAFDTQQRELLVPSATVFERYVGINQSRRVYSSLVSTLRRLQLVALPPVLGQPQTDRLLAGFQAGNLTPNESRLVAPYLQGALSHLSIARASVDVTVRVYDYSTFERFSNVGNAFQPAQEERVKAVQAGALALFRQQHEADGMGYLNRLSDFLQKNALLYPLYAASDAFRPLTQASEFPRDPEDKMYCTPM